MKKKDFPIFYHHPDLIYLDSAATTHKPQVVIDAISKFYEEKYATVHRGVYKLCQEASDLYQEARKTVASFISASHASEIIFTKNTTDSINLVAQAFGELLNPNDTILLTEMEHHSNLVPWQILAGKKKLNLRFLKVNDFAELSLDELDQLLTSDVKLLSMAHVSNVTGTIHPIKKIIQKAHQKGVKVVIDGAQAPSRFPVNVQDLDVDFYAFSSHKLYGPTGIGILYGKLDLLKQLSPISGGGDMIERVRLEKTTYQEPPLRFEAGTPMIVQAIGLKAAIDYLSEIGLEIIQNHEQKLLQYAIEKMQKIDGSRIYGPLQNQAGILSFSIEGLHPFDLATMLDLSNIAIRSGHLCAQPILEHFGIKQISRISFGIYNEKNDLDLFFDALEKIQKNLVCLEKN